MIDSQYATRLNEIAENISHADNFESVVEIRNELFSLIQKYISSIGTDREKISSFVQEIIKRILQIENHLLKSYNSAENSSKTNEIFDTILNKEIGELKTSVDVAECLDDLKSQVAKTLASIEKALLEKQKKSRLFPHHPVRIVQK